MSTSFRKCLTVVALLACFCGAPAPVRGQDHDGITLDEIKRRLTDWRSSFVNLRVVWELRKLPETTEPELAWSAPPDAQEGKLWERKEWIWAEDRDGLDLVEWWSFFDSDGSVKAHSRDVYKGEKDAVLRAQYARLKEGAPEEFVRLELWGPWARRASPVMRMPLWGLFWGGVGPGTWLADVLSQRQCKLEEIEEIDGQPCARLTTAERGPGGQPMPGFEFIEVLWLDLNHDCLVRRRRSPAVAQQSDGLDFIVDEFQRLDEGIWFPKRGRMQTGSTRPDGSRDPNEVQMFVVTEAGVNQSLDLARFETPAPTVDTFVTDYRTGASYKNGVEAVSRPGPARFVPQPMPGSVVPDWAFWATGLASVSMVLLTSGLWFARRNRKSR
jgi:hypothetical protein